MVCLVQASTGENALFVNGKMIVDGSTEDFSARMVEQIAERLAGALGVALMVQEFDPPSPEWTWEGESGRFGCASLTACEKCGSILKSGLCSDLTCPYSDWPQSVSLEDLENHNGEYIAAKYGLIRAEVHSDDHVYESPFFASEQWFLDAQWQKLAELDDEDWGGCEVADEVALKSLWENNEAVSQVFEYVSRFNDQCCASERIGFSCTINSFDALAWWRKYRYGSFALSMAKRGEFEVLWTGDKWAWEGDGKFSGYVFSSKEEAAIGAVVALELDSENCAGQPLYRLSVLRQDAEALVSVVGLPYLAAKFGLQKNLVRGEQREVCMDDGTPCVIARIQ